MIWFFVNDRIKLFVYKIFDPVKTKSPNDLKHQITDHVYEIYEEQGHREGYADQDWEKAEIEIRNEESLD